MSRLLQDQNKLAYSYRRSTSDSVAGSKIPYFVYYRLEALKREEAATALRQRSPSSLNVQQRPSTPPPALSLQGGMEERLEVPCSGCGRLFSSKSACKVHESRCPAWNQNNNYNNAMTRSGRSPSRDANPHRSPSLHYPQQDLSNGQRRGASSEPVLDVDSIPLQPPRAAAEMVNYAKATFDENSGGGILARGEASNATLVACSICGRRFNEDRIAAHKKACSRAEAAAKKRTAFDVRQQRVDAVVEANHADPSLAHQILAETSPSPPRKDNNKKSKWRQQSAALQQTMRASRGIAPAPGEEVVEDRVLCNGCGRRFAPETAERHIPNCVAKSRR